MARKHHKPRTPQSLKRSAPTKEIKKRLLIICEGETEVLYFRGLIKHWRLPLVFIEIVKSRGSAPKSIIKEAIDTVQKTNEPFDAVYCLIDRDEHAHFENAIDHLKTLNQSNDRPDFYAICSIPCFEYWLLLHFCFTEKPFQKTGKKTAAQNTVSELKKHLKGYRKTKTDLFNQCKPHLDTALENAKALNHSRSEPFRNPSTRVHELVEALKKEKSA